MELFLNRVYATLASGIDSAATTLPLTTGHGARFSTIGAGDKVRIVFLDATLNVSEVAYITAISGDNATITRGQDGTSGVSHLAGDRIEARIGKSTMNLLTQKAAAGTDAIAETHAATSKSTPVDADELPIADSATSFTLKRLTWANIKATSKEYFDTFYAVLAGSATQVFSVAAATAASHAVRADQIQAQSITAFTTAGTGSAFTLTPAPAIAANAPRLRFNITLHAAPSGSPTLAVSGKAALNFKYYDSTGAKQFVTSAVTPSGWNSDVIHDGTDWVMQKILPASANGITQISASVGSSALTISASALSLAFRSATLGSGTVEIAGGTPTNLVISSGSTLGTISAVQSRIVVLALNNAGTIELAAINISGGNDLSETGLISTTAEGGAGGADSSTTIYSTTARTNVAYRVIGYIESTQATAGTWATAPSTIQGAGGNALTAMSGLGYGQTWQAVTRTSGTTYYNTTGRPIQLVITGTESASATATLVVNGVTVAGYANTSNYDRCLSAIIPPNASYVATYALSLGGSPTIAELR